MESSKASNDDIDASVGLIIEPVRDDDTSELSSETRPINGASVVLHGLNIGVQSPDSGKSELG